MSDSLAKHIPLKILICDADPTAANTLEQALRQDVGVLMVKIVYNVNEADMAVKSAEGFNTVFIDPLSIGLESATTFVFAVRKAIPEVVFVLYFNKAVAESQREEFYRGERSRFAHYYELDKQTPLASFADELAAVVQVCRADLSWRMSAVSLQLLQQEANQLARSSSSSNDTIARQVKDLAQSVSDLRMLMLEKKSTGRQKRVFLSHRFAEKEYVEGLTGLLEDSGFQVVTGQAANTYISKAIIERIRECDYFLCLMTQDTKKADGTFTTSPWLLEEKGAALAFGKPIVLMVEDGVTDMGGLQGDWQRICFGQKGFLIAARQAVRQLKSYEGETNNTT